MVAAGKITPLPKDVHHFQPLSQLSRLEAYIKQVNFTVTCDLSSNTISASVDNNQIASVQTSTPCLAETSQIEMLFTLKAWAREQLYPIIVEHS